MGMWKWMQDWLGVAKEFVRHERRMEEDGMNNVEGGEDRERINK